MFDSVEEDAMDSFL